MMDRKNAERKNVTQQESGHLRIDQEVQNGMKKKKMDERGREDEGGREGGREGEKEQERETCDRSEGMERTERWEMRARSYDTDHSCCESPTHILHGVAGLLDHEHGEGAEGVRQLGARGEARGRGRQAEAQRGEKWDTNADSRSQV